jgi:hypothetical protein
MHCLAQQVLTVVIMTYSFQSNYIGLCQNAASPKAQVDYRMAEAFKHQLGKELHQRAFLEDQRSTFSIFACAILLFTSPKMVSWIRGLSATLATHFRS